MKIWPLIFIGTALTSFGIFIIAYNNENGDMNAISMYFLIYGIFAFTISVLNSLFLKFAQRITQNLNLLIGIGILPLVILLSFYISGIFRIKFIGEFGLFGIGITNFIWAINLIQTKNKKT